MSRPAWQIWRRHETTSRQEFDRIFEALRSSFEAKVLDVAARRRNLEEETRRARR